MAGQLPADTAAEQLQHLFLSRQDRLNFRSCVKLNCTLDNVLLRGPGQPSYATSVLAENPASYSIMLNTHCSMLTKSPASYSFMLNIHCSILVCTTEVIAAVVSGGRQQRKDGDPTDMIRIKNPKIVIAVNLDLDDFKSHAQSLLDNSHDQGQQKDVMHMESQPRKETKQQAKKQLKAEKNQKSLAKEAAKAEESARRAYEHKVTLTRIDATGDQEPPKDVLAAILDDMRGWKDLRDDKTQQKFNKHVRTYFQYLRAAHTAKTKEEHRAAVVRLQDYVYAKSCHKMLSRFNYGDDETRDGHKINFWSILTYNEAMPEHAKYIAMPAHLSHQTPNDQQAKRIRQVFSNADYIDRYTTTTIYGEHADRIRFQKMLRIFLNRAKTGIEELVGIMEVNNGVVKDMSASDVTSAVRYAHKGMAMLLNFLNIFEEFIEPHLEFLAECANVDDLKTEPSWTVSAKTPLPKESAKVEVPDAGQLEGRDSEFNAEDGFAHAQASASQEFKDRPFKAWAVVAKSFMRLPCSHEAYLREATAAVPGSKTTSEKFQSALIEQASITVVNFAMKSWDKEIAPIDDSFINMLSRFSGVPIDPAKLLGKKGYLTKKAIIGVGRLIQPSNPNIQGSSYCESILMSLIAIASDKKIMDHVNDGWLKHNGIFATAAELFELFGDLIDWYLGSKKACPPCELTRQQMKAAGITKSEFIAPGFHTKWSGVLLPAIMPKPLGEPVFKQVMFETARKLFSFQKMMDDQKMEDEQKAKLAKQHSSPQSEEQPTPAKLADDDDSGEDFDETPDFEEDEDMTEAPATLVVGKPNRDLKTDVRDFTQESQGVHKKAELEGEE